MTARGVSAYPAEVTAQMVANFSAGGAAINQLARVADAALRVVALSLDVPTADFTEAPAMTEQQFLAAVAVGHDAVSPQADLIARRDGHQQYHGGGGDRVTLFRRRGRWAGRGTGVDDEAPPQGIDHRPRPRASCVDDPLRSRRRSAARACRHSRRDTAHAASIPVCSTAVCRHDGAALQAVHSHAHRHISAEAGHRMLLDALWLSPLLDLNMRLGEGSGAAAALLILRAALACHTGMATFAEAGVSDQPAEEGTEKAAG